MIIFNTVNDKQLMYPELSSKAAYNMFFSYETFHI